MHEIQYLIERLERLDEKFDDKLDKILVQTTKTNGRVTNLESIVKDHQEKIQSHHDQLSTAKGGGKVIWVVLAALGALALSVIESLIN